MKRLFALVAVLVAMCGCHLASAPTVKLPGATHGGGAFRGGEERETAYRPIAPYTDSVRLYYRDKFSDTDWLTRMAKVPELPGMKPQACFRGVGEHIARCFYVGLDIDGDEAVITVPVVLPDEETV